MVKQSYRLNGSQKVYLLPISDLHIGSQQFNEEYFNYMMDTIDNFKSDIRIYLCGDLMEAANKQTGNAAFATNMTLDEQLDYAIKAFKPYKRQIVCAAIGNHEARLIKDHDYNIMNTFGKALKIPVGNQYLDTFKINGQELTVYAAHGKGSSAHHHTAQSKMIRDTAHIYADVLMHGHNHRCDHFSLPALRPTPDGPEVARKHYVFTGSFLRYNGYAEAMQLPILPESFIQLNVNKDLRIDSKQFNIDETRPDLLEL
jgi:UDP-2,3-diacylglucosamine pyrophosphatase LpxH